MRERKLDTLDLNLLRVFLTVMQEGGITAAGARLSQTQSAISHAVARLRQHLGDPLFVRSTSGMQPTPYAQTLAQSVKEAFETLRDGIVGHSEFDPASSTRAFTVLTTDMAEAHMFPALIARVRETAPHVSLVAAQSVRSSYRTHLEEKTADLAIGRLPENHVDFHQQHLFNLPFSCLLRCDHPDIRDSLSLEQFMAASHVSVSEPAQAEMLVMRALGKRADQRKIAVRLTHYLSVPMIVAATDLIAAIPVMDSEAVLTAHNLRVLPLPMPIPPMKIVQFWHERSHHDEGHRWLRTTVAKLFMGRMNKLHLGT